MTNSIRPASQIGNYLTIDRCYDIDDYDDDDYYY